jgi:UDP-N-acetyl-2-amino-2-deoxyglucuronate dehydrogenase
MASPQTTPLGFGIVGIGLIADFHAQAIAGLAGCRLVGVCGRSQEKADAFARKHSVGFATTDLAALLALPGLDVICVATPSGAHLEPALAAARAGKHIVIEKPIEITLPRIDALLEASRQSKVKVLPIFQARYGEGARRIKSALLSGRFGRLVLASAYVKWHRSAAYYEKSWHGTQALDGGGALINQAIHAVDLLQWFMGMPTDVFCWSTRRVHTGIEVEDTATATLRFASGALGTIEATTAAFPGWARKIEICGDGGSAILEDDHLVRWDFRQPQAEDAAIAAAPTDATMRSGASAPGSISHHGHQRQMQNLVDSIRADARLEVDGPEARKAVALILALYESARTHLPVHLGPTPA